MSETTTLIAKDDLLNRLEAHVETFAARVHPAYVAMRWTWGDRADAHVPTIAEIAACLRELIGYVRAAPEREMTMRTGGLRVWLQGNEAGFVFFDHLTVGEGWGATEEPR